MECHKCKGTIRGETGIRCEGICKKVFHQVMKCSGVDQYSLKVLNESIMIKFMCDDCMTYIHNIDGAMKEIQDRVVKNNNYLKEYKNEFERALFKNEEEIKQLLKAIETRFANRIEAMNKVQETCKTTLVEVKKMHEVAEIFNKQSERLCKEAEESRNENKRICNDMVKQITTNQREKKVTKSYAEKVKEVPQFRKEMPLIVKPKNKQSSEKTQNDLNENVDPNPLRIANIEKKGNGVIIIESENDNERSKIKEAIEKNLNKNYEVKIPDEKKPKFRIYNMKFRHNDDIIIEKLKKQNYILQNSNLKLKTCFEVKRENKIFYNAIVETDGDTFSKVINAEKLNIGWERCRVFDAADVTRCFKCNGYNHRAAECRNEEKCLKCHERHSTKSCKKEMIEKCINCIRANERLNMDFDINHFTTNKLCPVYINKIENYKKTIGY